MSDNIATAFAVKYGTNVSLLLQQKRTKLRGAVQEGTYQGKQAEVVTQYGPTEMRQRTTRYQPIVPVNTPNDRRWVFPSDFDWADFLDSVDKLRVLADPKSAYVQNGVAAANRKIDTIIITAFFADAKTGEAGGTTTTFPAGQNIDAAFGAAAATGMTVAKLREGRRILMENEVDLDAEMPHCAVSAEQHDDLLGEMQVISSDFNGGDRPVLKDGKVTHFLGIEFHHSERLDVNGSSQRRNPLWVPSGMHLGVWGEVSTDVSQRRDLEGLPWQCYIALTMGATRTEEEKVVEIECAE